MWFHALLITSPWLTDLLDFVLTCRIHSVPALLSGTIRFSCYADRSIPCVSCRTLFYPAPPSLGPCSVYSPLHLHQGPVGAAPGEDGRPGGEADGRWRAAQVQQGRRRGPAAHTGEDLVSLCRSTVSVEMPPTGHIPSPMSTVV